MEKLVLDDSLIDRLRSSLFAGHYNLLLGSGVSLGSKNRAGQDLRSSEQLRQDLCRLTGARSTTSLPRVYALLDEQQRAKEITDKYSGCVPGEELRPLPKFLWRRILTFNVDDVFETLYGTPARQSLISLNFDSEYQPHSVLSQLPCVHLHGHVASPESGYVFAHSEYVSAMTSINAWMVLLSEMLPAEPFIVAGTSLDEVDLTYYLSRRTRATPRRSRGPSLLVEPFPDAATEADCRRYDLTLVKATFGDFLAWLASTFPNPPTPYDLAVPSSADIFGESVSRIHQLRFFSDFELVEPTALPAPSRPSAYRYGSDPTWTDIRAHLDVERHDNAQLLEWARKWFEEPNSTEPMRVLSDRAATGKSTELMRLGVDLAALGHIVFSVSTLSKIDVATAARCIVALTSPVAVLADDFASHVEQIVELRAELGARAKMLVVGAERNYRQSHIEILGSESGVDGRPLTDLSTFERKQLIEVYRREGLLAVADGSPSTADAMAQRLVGEPVAVSVCRLLNDFRPIDRIVESLWRSAAGSQQRMFLAVALAHWCYGGGVRHTVLQAMAEVGESVDQMIDSAIPLALAFSSLDDDYVVPQNAVIADRTLTSRRRKHNTDVFDAFVGLARALAPWVNRLAIRDRTPEARLAGRLFDADKVVKPMLEREAEAFYVAVKGEWEWNSRYWEQRALLIADSDSKTAIQYAKRAVSIEAGPFALTTLGKVILRSLETGVPFADERESLFEEAIHCLDLAIQKENTRSRVTIHPFMSLMSGAARWLEQGGTLTMQQQECIERNKRAARMRFGGDPAMVAAIARVSAAQKGEGRA